MTKVPSPTPLARIPTGVDHLTSRETAAVFRVDRDTISEWVRLGKLPAGRTPGGTLRIPVAAVRELLGLPVIGGA